MIRIRLPFQVKIYLLFFILFAFLLYATNTRVTHLLRNRIIAEEENQFEGLKNIFYNLLVSKIETIRNEARLLASQSFLQDSLALLEEGQMVESFLLDSFIKKKERPLIIVTDLRGRVVDGSIEFDPKYERTPLSDRQQIQTFLESFSQFGDALLGFESVTYFPIPMGRSIELFAVISVPIKGKDQSDANLGTLSLGFAIDDQLVRNIRSGSSYHIGFIVGDRIVTSTFDAPRDVDFSTAWENTSAEDRNNLLYKAGLIELYQEEYLAIASHLPTSERFQGLYVILQPMEDTFRFINQLNRSVFLVSLMALAGTLLVGYILARRLTGPVTTLAGAVSKIAEGNYSVDASVKTGDELETLGAEINRMAETLARRKEEAENYVKQIETWNKELEVKVAVRTKDLEEKNFRLRMISEELGRAYARIDKEMKVIGELQKRLLPGETVDVEGLSIRSFYLPNGRAGGDYYDFISADDRYLFVLIADVSGHGIPAAFIMGITRVMAHTLIEHHREPEIVLEHLNTTLMSMLHSGEFVTMFLGRLDLDTYEFTYSSAGHQPPLLYHRQSQTMDELSVNRGLPLGIVEEAKYEEIVIHIGHGDRLLLYTDGIIEAFNDAKKPYELRRLKETIINNAELDAENLLDAIMRDLEEYVQRPLDVEPLDDDVTLVAIDFLNGK